MQSIVEIFDGPFPHTKDNQTVTLQSFCQFLLNEQNDLAIGKDMKSVSNFISEFVQDPQREIQEPYLTISEVEIL